MTHRPCGGRRIDVNRFRKPQSMTSPEVLPVAAGRNRSTVRFAEMEPRGLEPLTFCMPCRRAPNCAMAPTNRGSDYPVPLGTLQPAAIELSIAPCRRTARVVRTAGDLPRTLPCGQRELHERRERRNTIGAARRWYDFGPTRAADGGAYLRSPPISATVVALGRRPRRSAPHHGAVATSSAALSNVRYHRSETHPSPC